MAEIDVQIKAVDQTRKGTAAAGRNIDRLGTSGQKSLGGIRKAAIGVGVAIAAIGVGKALSFFGDLKDSATALGESANAVNVVFGTAADTILEFGKTSASTLALSRGEFQQLSIETGTLLKGFGLTVDSAAERTVNLAERATDLASVFNVDVDLALSAVNQPSAPR